MNRFKSANALARNLDNALARDNCHVCYSAHAGSFFCHPLCFPYYEKSFVQSRPGVTFPGNQRVKGVSGASSNRVKIDGVVALRRTGVRYSVNMSALRCSACEKNLQAIIIAIYLSLQSESNLGIQVVLHPVEVLEVFKPPSVQGRALESLDAGPLYSIP